jgi:hypothetical protein
MEHSTDTAAGQVESLIPVDLAQPNKTVNEYLLEDFKAASDEAVAAGMTVVRSTPTTLLLDLDTSQQRDQYKVMFKRFNHLVKGANESDRWASKSGDGIHVVVTLPEPRPIEDRLLFQAVLGSDPVREMLGLALLRAGEANPIMLFKPAAIASVEGGAK